jgi:nucleotide-binding universal stress UspA family protein
MNTVDDRTSASRTLVVPEKILVATDLTDAEYLVPHAVAQARACGATLTLVHVIPPGAALALDARAIPFEDAAAMAGEAATSLEAMAAGIRRVGIACDTHIVYGFPREQIAAVAREIGAGRILAGTHGRRNLRKFFLGSVAHEILRSAEVPVFTIGPQAHEASSFGAPRKILHPVSLCSGYQEGARIAFELAQFYRADLTLLHILSREVQKQPDAGRLVEWTKSEIEHIIPDDASLHAHAVVQVSIGDVVEEVLKVGAETAADLIVLGVNSDLAFWPIRGDDTVYKIIAQAKSPVLSIRRTAERSE